MGGHCDAVEARATSHGDDRLRTQCCGPKDVYFHLHAKKQAEMPCKKYTAIRPKEHGLYQNTTNWPALLRSGKRPLMQGATGGAPGSEAGG
jgi:hypothetical protein